MLPSSPTATTRPPTGSSSCSRTSTIFNASDPDSGDTLTSFDLRDRTLGGGYLTLNGVHQTDGNVFMSVPYSQLSQWAFVVGPSGSVDTVAFAPYDSHGVYTLATATVSNPSPFNIQINYSGDPTYQSYFTAAAARWAQVITQDIPDVVDAIYGAIDDLKEVGRSAVIGGVKTKRLARHAGGDQRRDNSQRRPRLLTAGLQHDGGLQNDGGHP